MPCVSSTSFLPPRCDDARPAVASSSSSGHLSSAPPRYAADSRILARRWRVRRRGNSEDLKWPRRRRSPTLLQLPAPRPATERKVFLRSFLATSAQLLLQMTADSSVRGGGVRVEFAADFATKPSMGYLRKCYEVIEDDRGWNLERIVDADAFLQHQPAAHRDDLSAGATSGDAGWSSSTSALPLNEGKLEFGQKVTVELSDSTVVAGVDPPAEGSGRKRQIELVRDVYVPPKLPPALLAVANGTAAAERPRRTRSDSADAARAELLYPSRPLEDVPLHYEKEFKNLLQLHQPFGRTMCCEDLNSCCDGSIPGSLPLATWNHIRAFHDTYHVRELLDSTPRMLERHYTFYNLMSKHPQGWGTIATPERLLQLETGQGMWFVDCIFGALTVLLNALPAIEFEDGLGVAQQIYVASTQLLQTIAPHRLVANWTIPLSPVLRPPVGTAGASLGPAGTAPFAVLLGLGRFDDSGSDPFVAASDFHPQGGVEEDNDGQQVGRREGPCFGTHLKIFIHKTGEYERGGLFCSAGQWGVEVILHRYLMNSSCRTSDPSQADLFLVPDYRACHYHLTPKQFGSQGLTTKKHVKEFDDAPEAERNDPHSVIIVNHANKTRLIKHADRIFTDLVDGHLQPWFRRNHGADHVFIFSDQGFIVNFTHTFPSWREHIHNSVFLTTEAFTPRHGPSCFSPWKDWVVPGHLDEYRIAEIRKWNLPSRERSLLFSFHGRTGNNHEYYKDVQVRIDIEKYFGNKPNTSIGDFTPDYFEILGKSHFCLIPEGTSSWTNHLYTAFFAGCVPIILSDRFVLPFQNHVNWKRLSVRWPQDQVSEQLYYWVAEYVVEHFGELEKTKALLDAHQCWFDWYDFEKLTTCSPYKAILQDLAGRKDGGKKNYRFKFGWIGHEGEGGAVPSAFGGNLGL